MKKFIGNLDNIVPSKLINQNDVKDLDCFFLVLGLIYNDLKGLILFDVTIREIYEKPTDFEPTVHAGEYSGIRLQIERLMIGLVSEFFVFLRENKATLNSTQFGIIFKQLTNEAKKSWNNFVLISNQTSQKGENFFKNLARIRSNVVFHYNYSGEELAKGYINKFYIQEKTATNKKAFFSLGSNMESTRFFYCDGAIEAYLMEHLKIKPLEKDNYLQELQNRVSEMNIVIGALIRKYLEKKKS